MGTTFLLTMVCHGDYTEAKILNSEPLQNCWHLEGQNHSIPPGNGQSKRLNNSALLRALEGGKEGKLRSCLRQWFTPARNCTKPLHKAGFHWALATHVLLHVTTMLGRQRLSYAYILIDVVLSHSTYLSLH